MRPAQVVIDLAALRNNLTRVRQVAPGCRVMAAVKANGYGHGIERVAHALDDADALGVACLEEAQQLREAGVSRPIMLLEGFFTDDELAQVQSLDLILVIHHREQLERLLAAPSTVPLKVWLKVDTGMHRLGLNPSEVAEIGALVANAADKVSLQGVMTHLACADDRVNPMTEQQLVQFAEATASIAGERSVANSAGILGWPASHADWVRPGIMLYGVSPFPGQVAEADGLQPVMTLRSALMAVNWLEAGDSVGYGSTWRCPEPMPVGVVAIGYGDGYPRHAPNGTPVLVNGQRVPLVGRVSMDMVTVDLRQCPQARVGDPVVLWGEGLPAEEVAECAGTIAYELLCGVTQRLDWRVVGG